MQWTDTKLYAPVVTLSTQNNSKLIHKLKSDFKIIINKYQSQVTTQTQNQYLDYTNDPGFQGVNKHFVFFHLKIIHTEQYTQDIYFKL